MDQGNWVPMDKFLTNALPTTRPYTLIEAAFSYQVDSDNGTVKSFREYSRIWQWSISKVIGFIRDKQATKTEQTKNTHKTVKFRFIKKLQKAKVQANNKQMTKLKHADDTTINPNPKKNIYTSSFEEFWSIYPRKQKKSDAFKAWKRLNIHIEIQQEIISFVEKAKQSKEWTNGNGKYIPHATTFLNGHRWEDELTFDKDWRE